LTGVLEADPDQQLDDLCDGELVEQHLDLGVADRGVVAGDRVGKRNRQRLPARRVIRTRLSERGAERQPVFCASVRRTSSLSCVGSVEDAPNSAAPRFCHASSSSGR
jgi:hypothetical protein